MNLTMPLFIILSLISAALSFSSGENMDQADRLALLALKDEFIAGGTPFADGTALSSWNTSLHFCKWQGITCGKRHKRVTAIELVQQNLKGLVSPSIGNLTFLRTLILNYNSLHGEIPKEIGRLRSLKYLSLGKNSFQGQIPVELSNCSNLVSLRLMFNDFTGQIPLQFGSLLKLVAFSVEKNNLVGEMPSFFRNFSSLDGLHLGYNHFHGEIRDCVQGLSKLTFISLASNKFSGTISPLYNLSSLDLLELFDNNFTGNLAQEMGTALPRLNFLSLSNNRFSGTIPSSLSNISQLIICQLNNNRLTGPVPKNLGMLKSLRSLVLSSNLLGSNTSNDLDFIDSLTNCTKLKWLFFGPNRFGGTLTSSFANFTSALEIFNMYENFVTGPIPEGIGELSGLSWIDFGNNLLTGDIPISIGKLSNMNQLIAAGNNLHGEIPSSIGNLTNLFKLDLSANSLIGAIPASIGKCKGMRDIDISSNRLSGNVPDEICLLRDLISCDISHNSFDGVFPSLFGKLRNLNMLNVSYNKFSGDIPAQLGELSSLEFLIMAENNFGRSIPPSMGNLKGLKVLDISNNNLSGKIPEEITYFTGLETLNLSFNQLEGEIPQFKNLTRVSVVGNSKLCGGNQELHLQKCKHHKKGRTIFEKVAIVIAISVLASFTVFILFFLRRRKYTKANLDMSPDGYPRVTYSELFKATGGFAESNLIGSGSFGDVYRGILDEDERKPVAVKVLNLSTHGASKSFTAECNVLRSIRHRNLLRIITSCSSLDLKGSDFKALIFDFMSNGNLDSWLHISAKTQRETRVLSLGKRLEIAIDVGCALDYLHNGCEIPIVHCDLKPSNILLDDNMVACVGDFGLAKLLRGVTEKLIGGESLSTNILRGSIGYVAPEYGMGAAISAEGDIYSYGILLLELITRKRPTDDMFKNEVSLRSFTEKAIPDHVEDIVDQHIMNEVHESIAMQRNPEQIESEWLTILISFIEVGISCSAESARDRMGIQSAIRCLKRVKEKYDSLLVAQEKAYLRRVRYGPEVSLDT